MLSSLGAAVYQNILTDSLLLNISHTQYLDKYWRSNTRVAGLYRCLYIGSSREIIGSNTFFLVILPYLREVIFGTNVGIVVGHHSGG